MEEKIDKTMLERFIAGEASPDETDRVNRFLARPEGKLRLKNLLLEHWQRAEGAGVDERTMARWEATFRIRLDIAEEGDGKIQKINTGRKHQRRSFPRRYAAAIAIFILGVGALGGWWITQRDTFGSQEIVILEKHTPNGKRTSFALDDGTQVTLGPGSRLEYPKRFGRKSREVQLYGEAFFQVTSNPTKPFIVHVEDIRTEVLGTTFKINGYDDEPLKVAVETGKVRVDRWFDGQIVQQLAVLNPGEEVAYDPTDHRVETAVFAVSDLGQWREGKVVFNGTPFSQLTREIGRWYDVDVIYQESGLTDEAVTVTLDTATPLGELLQSLSLIMGFTYELDGKRVIIH